MGKTSSLYTPDDQQAEKSKLKESDDMRAPLAFLLGKLDFAKEFKSFQTRAGRSGHLDHGGAEIGKSRLFQGEFLATPEGEIHRVRVTGQDASKLDFTFSNEQLNAPVVATHVYFPCPARRTDRRGQTQSR